VPATAIDKTITMCLTTGRSGTGLLAQLLELTEDVSAFHEPAPDFHHVLDQVRCKPELAVEFVRDRKLPVILGCPHPNYVETSHLFGKGFFEAFVALDVPFQLIVLNRDPRLVAKSNWRIGTIPGRTKLGMGFLLDPLQPNVMKLPRWEKLSDYQLCYWYCLEMERRKSFYAAECRKRGGAVAEVGLDDLKDWGVFTRFCGELGLTVQADRQASHARLCATKVNPKSKHWPKLSLVPLARQEQRVWQALGAQADELRSVIVARYGELATHEPD
jgi:hypothetical protein